MGGELSFARTARRLARQPQFTVTSTVLAGVSAGAALAMWALLQGVLFTPLPFEDSARLVSLCERHERLGGWCAAATPTVAELGRRTRTLGAAGAGRSWIFRLEVDGEPATLNGGLAGPGFFEALGVRPELGRLPTADEMGESEGRVLLLGHALWINRFGGDPDVLGRVVQLGPDPHTVIGVLPEGFEVPDIPGAELWRPLHFGPEDVDRREWRGFVGVGRLRPGVDIATARSELSAIYRQLDDQFVEIDGSWRFDVIPLLDRVVGGVRGELWMFGAAVALFLLIGAANVLNLFSLRALRLRENDTIRWALGSRHGDRLTRTALEGLMVGAGALVLSLLSGAFFLRLFLDLAPGDIPRLDLVALDAPVVLAGALLAVGMCLVAALTAAYLTRPRGVDHLSGGRSSAGRWTRRVRSGLVSVESAMSLMLVASALILARSFQAYGRWDPGFEVDGLAAVQLFASTAEVTDAPAAAQAWRLVEEHAFSVPGVRAAATVSAGPLFGGEETYTYRTDLDRDAGSPATVRWYDASPGYFATLGRPLLAGRDFTEQDELGAEAVAVINQTMARRAFPATDPLGHVVFLPESDLSVRVVGVVADVPPIVPGEPTQAEIFWSNRQLPRWGSFLVLRAEPGTAVSVIESALEALEPTISVGSLRPLSERFDAALVRPRFLVFLVGVFASLAALLAAGGLFAVLSVSVAERMRELGIRVALGAQRRQVMLHTLRAGLTLAGTGALVGAGLYLVAESTLVRAVPGLAPAGVILIAGSIAVLLLTAGAAAMPAALRASRADPLDLLRDAG
jgi:putative ABC transport system permease protein